MNISFRNLAVMSMCALALAACHKAAEPAKPAAPARTAPPAAIAPTLPKEATDLAARIEKCRHFAGEEGYDAARQAEINKAMHDAKCDTVDAEEAAMRTKYASDAAVLKRLTDADNF